MEHYATVTITKEFEVEFPDEIFTEENLKWIREYCVAFSDYSENDIKHEIIRTWAIHGNGYYEQFGCSIGWFSYKEGFPHVKIYNDDLDVESTYLGDV